MQFADFGAGCAMSETGWRGAGGIGMKWVSLAWQAVITGQRCWISHEGMDRCEVLDVLRHRWLDVLIKEPKREEPTWAIRRRC